MTTDFKHENTLELYGSWIVMSNVSALCQINTPKWSFLIGKPMVVGYHHFRKPPICCEKPPTLQLFFWPTCAPAAVWTPAPCSILLLPCDCPGHRTTSMDSWSVGMLGWSWRSSKIGDRPGCFRIQMTQWLIVRIEMMHPQVVVLSTDGHHKPIWMKQLTQKQSPKCSIVLRSQSSNYFLESPDESISFGIIVQYFSYVISFQSFETLLFSFL